MLTIQINKQTHHVASVRDAVALWLTVSEDFSPGAEVRNAGLLVAEITGTGRVLNPGTRKPYTGVL